MDTQSIDRVCLNVNLFQSQPIHHPIYHRPNIKQGMAGISKLYPVGLRVFELRRIDGIGGEAKGPCGHLKTSNQRYLPTHKIIDFIKQ